jgi:hypothetical protein
MPLCFLTQDFYKWSIVQHQGKMAIQLSVFTSAEFNVKKRQEYLFRTREVIDRSHHCLAQNTKTLT